MTAVGVTRTTADSILMQPHLPSLPVPFHFPSPGEGLREVY
jgi:hypothetical protein